MRPRATKMDVPSTHDVKVHLHNECVDWLKGIKKDILVSCTASELESPLLTNLRQHQGKFRLLPMGGQQTIRRGLFLE
jgi:hypothetical protein